MEVGEEAGGIGEGLEGGVWETMAGRLRKRELGEEVGVVSGAFVGMMVMAVVVVGVVLVVVLVVLWELGVVLGVLGVVATLRKHSETEDDRENTC